jgi:hypothetical protein
MLDRPVDALVTHPDYRPARVRFDAARIEVVLAPGIRVFLRPQVPLQLDRGSVGAFLSLCPESPELAELPEGVLDVALPLSLGSEPTTEVVFTLEGHYRLQAVIRTRVGSRFGSTPDDFSVTLDEGFDVLGSDANELREFWLPPDLFEQAGRLAPGRDRR